MVNTIQIKRSNVAAKVPTAASLEVGELAVNFPDKKLYTKEPGGTVIEIAADAAYKSKTNTFTASQVIDVSDTNPALRVTQKGTGAALLVEDEANPDASPFIVDADGNVGIGVSPPHAGFKFHLKATTGSGILISGGQQNNLMFSNAATLGGFVMGRSYLVDDANNFFIRDETATALRMFIAPNGNVGFGGTQDPQKEVDIVGGLRVMQNLPATSGAIVIRANIGNTVGGHIQFVDNGATAQLGFLRFNTSGDFNLGNTGQSFAVLQNGTIQSPQTYANTGAGTNVNVASTGELYRDSSSIKYKKDVENLDPALTDVAIAGLRPVWYRTKNPAGDDKATWSHIGLIAEEVALVEPRLVKYRTAEVAFDANGSRVVTPLATPEPEDVDYARLSVLLLAKVQQLETRIAKLEARP
jgi:hypothetical protein